MEGQWPPTYPQYIPTAPPQRPGRSGYYASRRQEHPIPVPVYMGQVGVLLSLQIHIALV